MSTGEGNSGRRNEGNVELTGHEMSDSESESVDFREEDIISPESDVDNEEDAGVVDSDESSDESEHDSDYFCQEQEDLAFIRDLKAKMRSGYFKNESDDSSCSFSGFFGGRPLGSESSDDDDHENDHLILGETNFNHPEVMEALRANNVEAMKNFITKGFDVNENRSFCLFYAVSQGHQEMAETLLAAGAKRNCHNIVKTGILNQAIKIECPLKRMAMVKLLISSGVSVNNENEQSGSCMHQAVSRGDLELVKFLLNAGAKMNFINRINSESPLHLAISKLKGEVRLKMVKQLIDMGADVNIKDEWQSSTCLHLVCQQDSDRFELAKMLLEANASVNSVSTRGDTPLSLAASMGDCKLMKLLADAGADVNFTKSLGGSPLAHAVMNSHKDAVKMLLECGADFNVKSADGNESILNYAVIKLEKKADVTEYIEILKMLLDRIPLKKLTEEQKSSLFRYALKGGTVEAVHLLIENGIKVDKCGISFPLHEAATNRYPCILEFLLRTYLFDIDATDDDRMTALIRAIKDNNVACVRLLVEWGADVEKPMKMPPSPDVMSPLCAAVLGQHRRILNILLAAGAKPNPNHQNDDDSRFFVDTKQLKAKIKNILTAQSVLQANCAERHLINLILSFLKSMYCTELVDKCMAELEILKTHTLYGSVTLYDFLKGKDVTSFICNSDVKDKFESLNVIESFPLYGQQLDVWFSMACSKRKVMDEAAIGLTKLLGIRFRDRHEILRNVMLQLSMKDLRNLCAF